MIWKTNKVKYMNQYIDKDAVVAEIERRIKKYATIDVGDCQELKALYGAKCKALMEILSFIDTLEVKEVDLKRAIDKWIDDAAITHEDCSISDVINTAKHFFELGIKTKGD